MAIGLKKLLAGSGYEYLTRQVAVADASGHGHTSLADYYTAKGETPGRWWGAGLPGMGLEAGGPVTEEQMKRLFGAGLNPVTGAKLGRAYSVFGTQPTTFETELAHRLEIWQHDHPEAPVPNQVRHRLRTDLAIEWYTRDHGEPPPGRRELHSYITKAISHPRVAVPGSTPPSPHPSPCRPCGLWQGPSCARQSGPRTTVRSTTPLPKVRPRCSLPGPAIPVPGTST